MQLARAFWAKGVFTSLQYILYMVVSVFTTYGEKEIGMKKIDNIIAWINRLMKERHPTSLTDLNSLSAQDIRIMLRLPVANRPTKLGLPETKHQATSRSDRSQQQR